MGGSCTQVGEPEQSNRQTRRSPAHSRHNMHSFAGAKTPAWKRVAFALCCQVAKPDRHMGDGPDYKPPTQTHARHQRPDSTPFRRSPTPPSPTHSAVRSRISGKPSVVWGSFLPQKEPFPSSLGLYPAHPQPVGLHGLQRFKTTLRINVNFASPFPCLPPPTAVRLPAPVVQQSALGECIRII